MRFSFYATVLTAALGMMALCTSEANAQRLYVHTPGYGAPVYRSGAYYNTYYYPNYVRSYGYSTYSPGYSSYGYSTYAYPRSSYGYSSYYGTGRVGVYSNPVFGTGVRVGPISYGFGGRYSGRYWR